MKMDKKKLIKMIKKQIADDAQIDVQEVTTFKLDGTVETEITIVFNVELEV